MLGTYTENMNDVRYRDLAEYATMVMLMETMSDLKKQGKKITPAIMQEFRDNWTRDGQPMDFSTMKAKPSDFAALLRSTGAATFGSLDNAPTLEAGIADLWVKSRDEYDKHAASGNFLHVVTDPVIRKSVLDHAQNVMNKAIFTHKGKSARSLDAGDVVTFYGFKDPSYTFNSSVAPGTATEQVTGFAGADIVLPENQSTKNEQEAKKTAQTNQVIQTSETSIEEDVEYDNERLLGWYGGTIETEEGKQEYRGLSHLMGAYLTKADAEMVAKNIDDKELFDAELAHNGVELLKHMRSNGYGFNVKDTDKRNQIEVRMTAGENIGVRVFDTDNNGAFIGRIYDTYNTYNYNVKSSPSEKGSVKFNAQDSIAILDYVTGHNTGKVKKTVGNERSQVTLSGIDSKKSLQVVPIKGRYRALAFSGAPEAKEYIEQAIKDAQHLVGASFDVDGMQALIDSGLDNEDVLVTGPDFQAELEAFYSPDTLIREAQERAALQLRHSEEGGLEYLTAVRDGIVGNYEDGFNPSFVIDHMAQTGRGNERDAMMAALKTAGYDMSKISGNDFAVNAMKERLVTFNPETARKLEDLEHPMLISALTTVEKTLKAGGFSGVGGAKAPLIEIDDQGVIRWEADRRTGSNKADAMYQHLTGEIGQVMVPDENGIIKTQFQGDNNYGIVPGYTGHFAFEGDYDDRMKRFRVKGFDQHLTEQLQAAVTHQMTRPLNPVLNDIPTTLDASRLNGLYHGDVYGKRVDLDFLETSQLDMATKQAILTTLSGRVRFDNQFSDYATTSAETQANREKANGDDAAAFSYWKAAGEVNMRVLDADLTNYADMTMTGTGKTQGLIWFLADGAEINKDGSVTPSKGMLDKEGNMVPDVTALQKLPYFDKKSFNAWDRNQMSSNQLMTALKVDENVNTALMAFGGWTFDDSYAVSKEFADRNKVFGSKPNEDSMRQFDELLHYMAQNEKTTKEQVLAGTGMMWSDKVINKGSELRYATMDENREVRAKARETYEAYLEEHGRFRPLQRGDKLSDFGGNKGTIGIVIDRDMDPAVAKKEGLEKEVAFMKENSKLDVISAPYSMLSRHNAGVVKELMDGEVQDLRDPETGEVFKGAMGKLNIIVTDMVVDDKTHAYSREDVLDGKGRKASGQLAWALQSKDAAGILNEIYGRNDSAWSTYREYLIATGLDMKPDGTILSGYTPHAGEDRNHFAHEPDTDSSSFLEKIKDQGGFLDVPFELKFKNDQVTSEIPVLSASLRQNVELVDGSMRVSNFTNYYANLYDAVGAFNDSETDAGREKAQKDAQGEFDKIQSTIIDRQFDGGHNGKHSFIRDKIMGKRMSHSATGVAIVDPRLNIGEAGMNQEMMDALDAKEGDMVMAFRDPVWRDGAIRAMKVVKDDSVHGIAINPIADKSHDMDFDGDTMGIMKFDTKEANADLVNKFSHWSNMIDKGSGKDELYFQSGMDLASAQAKAEKAGDMSPRELFEKAHKNALTDSPKLHKQACRDLNNYSHKLFREHGFGGDFVSFTSDETVFNSFGQMVDNGAKGSPKKLEDYKNYHTGKKTPQDGRNIQYASGVKSDDTGLAGAFSQKLVAVMRNQNITAALESMYPLTQGTLQIKHDAEHAKVVNEILTDDMNKTFRGKDSKDSKKKLTPNGFKAQLTDIMENKMKVDVNEEFIDAVTETLTYKGQIIPLSDAMQLKGSPMDRVAYGGGYEELKRLGRSNESLLTGKQNELFAPFTMRNATAETKLAKRDTQRIIETPVLAPTVGSAPKSSDTVIATEKQVETEDVGLAI